ncbi:MAG TPA: hypothetical protein VM901_07360 [Bdellovibrionota bacterium]|jgi:hypothetical protein|nr:hypothetical protein [Bdellovibrionota bacterium]
MFDLTKKVSTYLTFALALPAFAQSLPSFTANCGKEQVNSPLVEDPNHQGVDLNGGYVTDRDCKQIFVLPPTRGRFLLSALAPNSALKLCSSFNASSGRITEIDSLIDTAVQRMKQTDDRSEKAEISATIADLNEVQLDTLKYLEKLSDYEGLSAQVQFENQWETVVRAYKEANPGKTVNRVPLVGAYLSATLELPSSIEDVMKVGSFKALKSAKIPGLSLVPDILTFTQVDTTNGGFVFSSSLGGKIVLSLAGACPYWDDIKEASRRGAVDFGEIVREKQEVESSLAPYLVANLQYFYPLETSFKYQMKYDTKVLASHFAELVKTKTTFDAKAIEDELIKIEARENMGVIIENGVGTDDTFEKKVQSMTHDLRVDLIQTLLSKIATPKEPTEFRDVPLPQDPHYTAFGEEYVCHSSSSWFGASKKKKCYSRTYTLKIPTEGVAKAVDEMAMDVLMDINHNFTVYKTFIMGGSLGFVEKQK